MSSKGLDGPVANHVISNEPPSSSHKVKTIGKKCGKASQHEKFIAGENKNDMYNGHSEYWMRMACAM